MATNKRGGPRHFPKPMIESGLLFQVFCKHTELVQNLKAYEHLSSGSTPDPKGMHYCLALVNELLELSPQAELHPQPLRDALLRLLSSKPLLNNTGHAGQVWVHQRADRVNVLLAHIRKLARSGPTARCAGNLTGLEFSQLQDTLKRVQLRPAWWTFAKGCLTIGKWWWWSRRKTSQEKTEEKWQWCVLGFSRFSYDAQNTWKWEKNCCKSKQALAKEGGAVSAPARTNTWESQKSNGCRTLGKVLEEASSFWCLQKACSCSKEHWGMAQNLQDNTKKKERAYLCGTKAPGEKQKLIVEVTATMSKQYMLIIEKIKEALENDNISKEEALKMRAELCKKFPWKRVAHLHVSSAFAKGLWNVLASKWPLRKGSHQGFGPWERDTFAKGLLFLIAAHHSVCWTFPWHLWPRRGNAWRAARGWGAGLVSEPL